LEIVKKNYQLVQQLQAADLISLLDQISAEVELLQAEYQMRVAITGFYLEKWKLQQLIGLELEV
jgi:outer membrane protein TolC